MKKIWRSLGGLSNLKHINTDTWRIIEDQSIQPLRNLSETSEGAEVLKKMVDRQKSNSIFYGDELEINRLHPFLSNSFKYPLLKNGTRFGKITERNLFYSSLELETAMCEKAFHRFRLLLTTEANVGDESISYMAFKSNVATQRGIDLCSNPFIKLRDKISSPVSYEYSQELGECLREEGVHAFISYSARSTNDGKNMNVFTPLAFGSNNYLEKHSKILSCYFTKKTIEFSNVNHMEKRNIFNIEDFYVNGEFPLIK